MQRRDFILQAVSFTAASLVVSGCTTSGTASTSGSGTSDKSADTAKRRLEIDSGADATLERLYTSAKGSRDLVAKANGVLVFPSVLTAGFVVGGQYGDGVLRGHGGASPALGYYSIGSASVGLLAGAQSKSIIFLFMTPDALTKFRSASGWSAGVDAAVAVMKVGANGVLDTSGAGESVLAFVLTNAGLMANLSLSGTKITPLAI